MSNKELVLTLDPEAYDTLYCALEDNINAYKKDIERNQKQLDEKDFSTYSEQILLDEKEFLLHELSRNEHMLERLKSL